MSKVYVVQESPGKNLTSVFNWGKPVVVFTKNFQVGLDSTVAIERASKVLVHYTDEDYIVAVGDPASIGIVCSIAAVINNGVYNLLKWDRQERTYYEIRIDLSNFFYSELSNR